MLRRRLLLAFAAAVFVVTAAPVDAWSRTADPPRIIEPDAATTMAATLVAIPVAPLDAVVDQAGRLKPVAANTVFRRPGLLNGIASGFLNAGLIGLVLGYGIFDELGGIASLVGLFLQLVLICVVARLSWLWWRRRTAPETAGLTPRQLADEYVRPLPSRARESQDSMVATGSVPAVTASDRAAFERLFVEVKRAYGSKDLAALRSHVTRDLFDVLSSSLSHDETGDLEGVSDIRLLDSKLAGHWREGDADFARLSIKFSLAEHLRDNANDHNSVATETRKVEATEVWTFMRRARGDWRVSAIQ